MSFMSFVNFSQFNLGFYEFRNCLRLVWRVFEKNMQKSICHNFLTYALRSFQFFIHFYFNAAGLIFFVAISSFNIARNSSFGTVVVACSP